MIPLQKMEFLRFILDSVQFTISVTQLKHNSLLKLICQINNAPHQKIKIQFLAQVIGKIVSIFPACDLAKLHHRMLEYFKTKMVLEHNSWNCKVCLSESCIHEVAWWYFYLKKTSVISKSLTVLKPTTYIFMDASLKG